MSSIRSFIPLEKLGEGTYSNVYKVRRVDDNEIYALKKVKLNTLNQKQKQNALNEVRILASIESTNIIAYKEAFFDESLNVLCVVMEFASDGDLQKVIKTHTKSFKPIEEQQIWKAAQNILKGLENLHSRGILHRDIKCANIFKSKGIYKLGDLNVSKVNGGKLAYTQTGTPYYASPQVWRDEPYDSKSDIWSFGCIIYEMASLKPPFNGKDMQDLFKNVQKAKVAPLSNHYSSGLWQFIQLCLQKDSKKRPSASQLLKQLKKRNSKATSGIKINNPESNQLLKTIKVPNDLKKLNEALPTSKYRKASDIVQSKNKQTMAIKLSHKQFSQNKSSIVLPPSQQNIYQNRKKDSSIVIEQKDYIVENKEAAIQQVKSKVNSKENRSAIFSPYDNRQPTSKNIANEIVSYSYRSPKNKVENNKLFKSPASEVRLGKKVQSGIGYSQRLQKSDRKPSTASKVERVRYEMEMDIKNLAQQLKKPISMPRTQKKPTLINNSHLIQNSYMNDMENSNKKIENNRSYAPSGNYSSSNANGQALIQNRKYEVIDIWKNKLLKKNRILSSNQAQPSWW